MPERWDKLRQGRTGLGAVRPWWPKQKGQDAAATAARCILHDEPAANGSFIRGSGPPRRQYQSGESA